MNFIRMVGAGVAITCTALLSNTAIAASQPSTQKMVPSGFDVRQDGSWTYYDRELPSEFTVRSEDGGLDRDGKCSFSSSMEMSGDEGLIEGVEIAYNAKSCQRKVAERRVTAATARAIEDEHYREVGAPQLESSPTEAPDSGSADTGMAPAASRRAQTTSWFEDPPGIDVTWTKVTTSWNYNGSCVTSHSPTAADNWFKPSGWTRIGDSWSHPLYCAYSKSSAYRNFRNGKFCATIDTYNKYNNTEVVGKANGSSSYLWNNQKSGGCTSLLTHRYLAGTY